MKKILLSCILGVLVIALCVTGTVLIVNKECSHTYGDWSVTLTANCESSGEKERVCSKCGEVEKSEVAALGHDWKGTTCKEAKTCLRCGKTEGELSGHTFVLEDAKDEALKQAASCTSGAVYFKSCSVCGAISENEADTFVFGDKLPHDFTKEDVKEAALKTAATCKDKAVYFKSCSVCGAVSDSEKDVFEHGDLASHSFTKEDAKNEALKTPANCSNAAIYYKSCETCGVISQDAADTFSFGEPSGHSFTKEIANDNTKAWDATCTSPATYYKTCALCGKIGVGATFTVGEALGHTFNQETISEKTLKVEATCQSAAKYAKSCETCGAISNSEADYFENGEKAQCSYVTPAEANMSEAETKEYLEKEGVLVSAADCENKAVYLKFCKCCKKLSDGIQTFEYGDALGHDYSKEDVKEAALKTAATCTEDATYYKSCSKCGKVGSDATFENENSALGHKYIDDDENSKVATCTAPAKKAHKCERCGDTYSEDVGAAKGHAKGTILPDEQIGNTCEYKTAYTCSECEQKVYGDNVFKHTYVAQITKAATCQTDGEKTLTCSNCGNVKEEKEVIKANKNGHNWVQGSVATSKRTDTCSVEGCGETKTVVVYDTNDAEISASDLNEEIALKDASFNLDANAVAGLGEKDVSLSMSTLTDEERDGLEVSAEKMQQVGDNPIYNFNMSGEGEAISSFDGYITITLPYELGENEDVDSIAVWYINASGELESIEAVYNNGYITFKTNHFSYYTVTRLTPKERCALYGHSEVKSVINGGCLKDSYTLYTCIRCHAERIDEDTVVPAKGHNYNESTEAATCTKNGKITYTCQNAGCGYFYIVTIPAKGHKYKEIDTKAATCQTEGFIEHECENEGCEFKYTEVLSKKDHNLGTEITAPTCDASGYTKYFCKNEGCDYTYNKDYVAAKGHIYDFDDPEKTVWNWSVENQSQAGAIGAAAGVTAEVEFHCTVCSHSEKLTAGVSFKIKYGKCSGYVKTTFTAAVTFAGDIRSDEYEIVIGDENHKFSQSYKYDDDNHWHECVCGEKDEVVAHVFENGVVKKQATCGTAGEMVYTCVCGAKKTEVIPATGEHSFKDGVCEVCGSKTFYTNLLSSHVANKSYVLTVKNLSLYSLNVDIDGNRETTKVLEQVDVIWLSLYNENGELKGEGELNITGLYLGTLRCSAYIENGFVYISASAESASGSTDSVLCKMSTRYLAEELFGSIFGSGINLDDESVKALKEIYQKAISPALNVFVKTNGDKVESVLSGLFEMAFTREKTTNGYKITLDYDKLSALNKALAEKTFAEVIDMYFGEGSFEKAVDEIIKVLKLTPNQFVEILSDAGIDLDEFIGSLNGLFDLIYGAGFDDEWFADYGEATFGNFVFDVADDSYIGLINNTASMLKENSIYALICGKDGVSVAKRNVDDAINALEKWVGLSITTNGNGRLIGLDCEVKGLTDDLIYGDFNIVASDKKPEFTLGGLVGEVNGAIIAPSGEVAEELGYDVDVRYDYWTNDSENEIRFGSETFYSVKAIYIEKLVRGNHTYAQANPCCKDWVYIQEGYQATEYFLRFYFAADNTVLLTDGKTNLKLSKTENGFALTNDDGTLKTVTLVLPESSEFDSAYEYEKALAIAYENVALEFIGELYGDDLGSFSWYFNYSYYYNVKTGEYSLESPHKYETTYKFLGNEDCSDGVKVTKKCTLCGAESSHTTYMHTTESKEVKVEGFCGVTVIEEHCAVCDKYNYTYLQSYNCDFRYSGEKTDDGYQIYTCETCGGSYYEYTITSEKDVNNNCRYTETTYLVFLKDGEEVYKLENVRTYSDHNYTYEFSGGEGESCENCEYVVTETCVDCGYSYSYHEYYSHCYEWIQLDLKDKGFCGVYLGQRKCLRCEEINWTNFGSNNCYFSYSGETEEGYSIYTCETCGGSYYRYTVTSEKDVNNNCKYTRTTYLVFLKDGKEVYRVVENKYTGEDHNYSYEFNLYGEACEDGYKVTATCKDCGYVSEYESTQHERYQVFELGEGDWCAEHYLRIKACPCGYSVVIYTNDVYSSSGETAIHCETCGLTLKRLIEKQQLNTCLVNEKTSLILSFNGETLYSWENKGFNYHDHDFGSVQIKTDEEGVSYISEVCSKCSEELASSIVKNSTFTLNDSECEFDFIVTEDESNYGFLFDSYVYVKIYCAETENYVYGSGWRRYHTVSLSQGEYKVRVCSDDGGDEVNLLVLELGGFVNNYVRGAYCNHYTKTTKLLLNGDSCEGGVLSYGACPVCGAISELNLSYGGHIAEWEYIDLSEYNVCEDSYMGETHCACFKVISSLKVYFDGCDYKSVSNKYVDEEGKTIYVEERYCSTCGLFYQYSYYDVYDEENCLETRYYTKIVKVNDVLIAECSYEDYYSAHNYDVTYELLGGEGSSCEDGVKIIYTCKNCEDSYTNTNYYHRTVVVKETIDLFALGSACGGNFVIKQCPCGYAFSYSFDDALCDFDENYYYDGECVDWIEGAINDSQTNSSGNCVDCWTSGRIYTCSVTDPKSCGFKIRRISYYKKAENECKAYYYVRYQFGYDDESGTCKLEKEWQIGDAIQWHTYGDGVESSENGVNTYVRTCTVCNSTYTARNYTDEQGRSVYERVAINALENEFNKSCSRVSICTFNEEGNIIEDEYSYIYVLSDGTEWFEGYAYGYIYQNDEQYESYCLSENSDYWHRRDYTYDFTNSNGEGCLRTCVYTNSNGEEWGEKTENCCRYSLEEENIIKYPTCTQVGSIKLVCRVCNTEKIAELRPVTNGSWALGHNFIKLENGKYFCSRCGIENENGADGLIVLEDLTASYGNGEYYVAGYYKNSNALFTNYVSLILVDGTEIVLENVDFEEVEGLTAIKFSKAQIKQLAEQKGVTGAYDVRLAFVPVGLGGSLDYAITFTEDVAGTVTEITDGGSFLYYKTNGENLKITITPSVSGIWSFTSVVAGGDPYAVLYDENGNRVASDDDGGSGMNFLLSCELEEGKTYTLEIRNNSYEEFAIIGENYKDWYSFSTNGSYIGIIVTAPESAE